ncbi:MAG: hypothetical protein K0U86_00490 [Planctomycetes bacterium]|nr:hypothetical protein [Planctomycetota bacterium]MCH9723364.1 hypothetical protein [Planctomycetota bacterium]MCH9779061.1 hypothetical protein [Planctomycetota bacterium]MCH9790302.1 hypothetical protein [Planctomycetota bacterium]
MTNQRAISKTLGISLLLILFVVAPPSLSAAEPTIQIGTFSVDITPELNQPIGMGFIPIPKTVEHPLLAKGILLKQGDHAYVLCALDWMEVHNESYDFLRAEIAKAANTTASCVALQCLHQHTGPAIDSTAQKIQFPTKSPRQMASLKYEQDVARKLQAAIKKATQNLTTVTHIGTSKCKVDRVASNRRIKQPDGSIKVRSSSTKIPELHAAPEGIIDPWLRTLSFYAQSKPLVQIHYYATHPQSFYGDARISYDTVGIAREQLQQKSNVFQVYFTGCGGNTAMGKYNNGSRKARNELTNRLSQAMEGSLDHIERTPIEPLQWQTVDVNFPVRRAPEFLEERNQQILKNPKSKYSQVIKAAINLAWIERAKKNETIEFSCLSFGKVKILHLPGEPFVEFQLAAQKRHPELSLFVAGYGDCGMSYIGTDKAYSDRGGYEQTWSFIDPSEALFLDSMSQLLNGKGNNH